MLRVWDVGMHSLVFIFVVLMYAAAELIREHFQG